MKVWNSTANQKGKLFSRLTVINHIVDIHSKVKNTLSDYSLKNIPILYGGSVNPNNSKEILSSLNVNGVLVGGASTKFDQLEGIVNSI